jgi:hypothetical protein
MALPEGTPPFLLGTVVATPGALERFGTATIAALLARHASGDWGDLCASDRSRNERALRAGERIFSAYDISGIAPSRRPQIAQFGIRAVLAGTLANLMSAAIAGILIGGS